MPTEAPAAVLAPARYLRWTNSYQFILAMPRICFCPPARWLVGWLPAWLLGCILTIPTIGQQLPPVPDSLRAVYQAAPRPNAARLAVLLRIAYAYIEPLDSAGVLDYGSAAERLARQLGDSVGVGQAVDVRGHYYQQVSNQTMAQPLLERAERLLTDAPPRARATSYYHLGWLYDEMNQGRRALRYYRRAYALAGQTHAADLQASVLNSWASVYMYSQQYDSAQYYMLRALRLQHRLGERGGEAAALGNLASILGMAGRPQQALPYARQAARMKAELGDSIGMANSDNTLGDLANRLDSLPQAQRYYREAISIGRRYRLDGVLSMAYVGLADVFAKTGALDSAEQYYVRAIRQAEQANHAVNLPGLMLSLVRLYARQPARLPDATAWTARLQGLPTTEGPQPVMALEAQALVAEASHDYARALALHKQLDELTAQTRARNNERLTQEMRTRFDTERAEQQVELLKQARELERLRRERQVGALIALAVGLLALVGGVVWWYRRRQQQRDTALRMRLAADLHDDVGSLLSQIALQTDLLNEGLTTAEQQPAQLAEVAGSSRMAVRQLNDVVWSLDAHNDTLPGLLARLRDYAHDVLHPTGRPVHFQLGAVPALDLPPDVRRHLYLIYKEALHNILKYAPVGAPVTISLHHTAHQLELTVTNDGPPPAPGAAAPGGRSSGHGLRNIRERATALGGHATTEARPEGGFVVHVSVPLR